MNREAVANELLRIAEDLMAMDFPTQDAYDKYLKEHPDADKSKHHVKETKQKTRPNVDKGGKRIKVDGIVSYPDSKGKEQSGNVVDILDSGDVVIENDEGDEVKVPHDKVQVRRGSTKTASVSRYCEFFKTVKGTWYMNLADHEYGEYQNSRTYGPFPSEEAAQKYLHSHFSNPGSYDTDDSGTRPIPMRSPNGMPVEKPRSGMMWGSTTEKVAKDVMAVTQRPYFKGCAAIIAREVVDQGKSLGWIVVNRDAPNFLNTYNAARDAETTLKRFNIGYQDDMLGEWGHERGGSDFFQKGGEFDGGN
jgi:hypothetical protein